MGRERPPAGASARLPPRGRLGNHRHQQQGAQKCLLIQRDRPPPHTDTMLKTETQQAEINQPLDAQNSPRELKRTNEQKDHKQPLHSGK